MNFDLNTLWFEVAVISGITALGQIFFAPFAEKVPQWKRVVKLLSFVALACASSIIFGRPLFFVMLSLLTLALILVHAVYLPLNGVNGLTGEPRAKYDALRGWQVNK